MNIPLNIDWQQILLHLLNFAILAGGLYLLLFKPVKAFMEKRESYYQNMDSEAKQKLQDAEALKDSYTRQLDSAAQEIAQKKADAQKAIEASRSEQLKAAKDEADRILQAARANTEREHDKMLRDAQKEMADLAVTAAEKLLLKGEGSPYEQFLNAANAGKRGEPDA
ncbi:MAG TPA: ATP synthase F0 subunit B [Candidatus Faecivivens stercoravium]|uniref:ATP synthase subunit b n=1 Tax=Candidatus Faecivivens stercoravium TaxID=2840803 RepID=A0A9D1DWD7_9FIRM|nr:ATP synthase F0 subunit B [Candidatus Faecivivens stercoravium]